jgi:hypothetical protein
MATIVPFWSKGQCTDVAFLWAHGKRSRRFGRCPSSLQLFR